MFGIQQQLQQEGLGTAWFSNMKHVLINAAGTPTIIDETNNGANFFLLHSITLSSTDGISTAVVTLNGFVLIAWSNSPTAITHRLDHLHKGTVMEFNLIGTNKPQITAHYQYIKFKP